MYKISAFLDMEPSDNARFHETVIQFHSEPMNVIPSPMSLVYMTMKNDRCLVLLFWKEFYLLFRFQIVCVFVLCFSLFFFALVKIFLLCFDFIFILRYMEKKYSCLTGFECTTPQ